MKKILVGIIMKFIYLWNCCINQVYIYIRIESIILWYPSKWIFTVFYFVSRSPLLNIQSNCFFILMLKEKKTKQIIWRMYIVYISCMKSWCSFSRCYSNEIYTNLHKVQYGRHKTIVINVYLSLIFRLAFVLFE